jgi:hypothetical protein
MLTYADSMLTYAGGTRHFGAFRLSDPENIEFLKKY